MSALTDKKTEDKNTKSVEKTANVKVASKTQKKQDENVSKILLAPYITEKATDQAALNKYTFIVAPNVNKNEVIKKVKNLYGVNPIKVNFIYKPGKKVRYGRKFSQRSSLKKAIVTLPQGENIELYEGV